MCLSDTPTSARLQASCTEESWAYLRDEVLPGILAARGDGLVRVWSAGCASGEETAAKEIYGCILTYGGDAETRVS